MRIKGIIGAVIGDIAGSSHEFNAVPSLRFKLFDSKSSFTDDTVLTMAVAEWMMDRGNVAIDDALLKWGRDYPNAGYGKGFKLFLKSGSRPEQGSEHNGSAMRVSPVGFLSSSLEETISLAKESALPSHNTPGAIAGAQALAAAIYLARTGSPKNEIRNFIEQTFGYNLSRTYNEVRAEVQRWLAVRRTDKEASRKRLLSAEATVQDALAAFLAGEDYENTIRLAVWMGGDSDTVACMAGAVASAFWGAPEELIEQALPLLPPDLIEVINRCDGTKLKPTGITPNNPHRWKLNDVVVYGANDDDSTGEQGFYDVRLSSFNHHPNKGYRIVTIGRSLGSIASQVETLRKEVVTHPEHRYLIREIGISKAGFTVEQMAPLFAWALPLDNVFLPKAFIEEYSALNLCR